MNERNGLPLILRALVACVALATIGTAAAAAEKRVQFNIAPQDLLTALNEFAQQSDQELLFSTEVAAAKRTDGVTGEFLPSEALRTLLNGTGLGYRFTSENTILIERTGEGVTGRQADTTSSIFRSPFVLAQATPASQGAKPDAKSNDESKASESNDREGSGSEALETVVVTGSHIRGVEPVGSQLITIDRTEIEKTGYATVQDVMRTLPQNFAGRQETTAPPIAGSPGNNPAFSSGIDLRGLGADATLTLLNGRRLAQAGIASFVDVSAIPLTMVERIEIVPDSASAIYGSDAIGGVVNVRLRERFQGAETELRYGELTNGGAPSTQLGQVFGGAWNTGRFLFGYEYYERDPLPSSARAFTADSDLRPFGGSNFSGLQSNPGNITRIGTTPVILAVPRGQDGTALSESELLPGQVNFHNFREIDELIPQQTRHSVVVSGSQAFGERWKVFADALYSDRDFHYRDDRFGLTLTIPESNAYRTLNGLFPGQGNITMNYNPTDDLGPIIRFGGLETISGTLGVSAKVSTSWTTEMSLTYGSVNELALIPNNTDQAAVNAALASSDRATAFNPFADGSNTSPSVLAGLVSQLNQEADSVVRSVGVIAGGNLFEAAGGDVRLAIGADLRHERYSFSDVTISASGLQTISTTFQPLDRTVRAAFAEAYVPIVSDVNQRRGLRLLDLSLSARYENYTDVGESTVPKLGLRWSPVQGLSFRGSYGESFKAPLLTDLARERQAFSAPISAVFDPFATDGSTLTLLLNGGNPNLKPETADTWSVGVEYAPPTSRSPRVEVTYFRLDLKDRVNSPSSIVPIFATAELFPGRLIRNPTPAQIDAALAGVDRVQFLPPTPAFEAILDAGVLNTALVKIDGIDFNATHQFATQFGDLSFSVAGSYLLNFREQFSEPAPQVSVLSTLGRPVDLRVRGGLSWTRGGWGSSLFVNYVDEYRDTTSVPNRSIDSWTTLDLQLRYEFEGLIGDRSNRSVVSLSATNLLDEDPPFANSSRGFGLDAANADPFGRHLALKVSHRW